LFWSNLLLVHIFFRRQVYKYGGSSFRDFYSSIFNRLGVGADYLSKLQRPIVRKNMLVWSKIKKLLLYLALKALSKYLSRESFLSGCLNGNSKGGQYSHLDVIDAYINVVRAHFLIRTGGSVQKIEKYLSRSYHLGRVNGCFYFCIPYLIYSWERSKLDQVNADDVISVLENCRLSAKEGESLLAIARTLELSCRLSEFQSIDRSRRRKKGCLLPLANFWSSQHVDDGIDYQAASRVFQAVNEFSSCQLINDVLLNGKVCVVGNSPNMLGGKKGEFVDSHDVVVRFNNCSTGPEYEKDVGTKTTIWARSGADDVKHDVPKGAMYVLWEEDYFRVWCKTTFIRFMEADMASGKVIGCIDPSIRNWVRDKSDIYKPSTGLLVLSWLYFLRGGVSRCKHYRFFFTK
jgi:hypothetical protein